MAVSNVGTRDVFVWRDPEDFARSKDPSALPADCKEHDARAASGLWGPRYARIFPGKLLSITGNEATVSMFHAPKKAVVVPSTALLLWSEGLLVLDSLSMAEDAAPWFKELAPLLEQQRARYKNGRISSATYVKNKLLTTAVTGPNFVTGDGASFSHRRARMYEEMPKEAVDLEQGYYSVEALTEYMPPWEAFVHPKCGLYQDFYAVRWAGPFQDTDYSDTEQGCDGAVGSTWEPDECLPDDLDQLRIAAKKTWVEKQLQREHEQLAELELRAKWQAVDRQVRQRGERGNARFAPKRPLPHPGEEEPAAKRIPHESRLAYNPLNVPLKDDLWQPHVFSGFLKEGLSEQDTEVHRGWPKKLEEYPDGYLPAMPPGCCSQQCDCMEDWHFGRNFDNSKLSKSWVEVPSKSRLAEQAVDTFKHWQAVRARGQVTQKWYIEPNLPEDPKPPPEPADNSFVRCVLEAMREAAQAIPLKALCDEAAGSSGLFRALAAAFAKIDEPAYEPLTYKVVDGPEWLRIAQDTGTAAVEVELLPPELLTTPGMSVPLRVNLGNITTCGPLPDHVMECRLLPQVPESGAQVFATLTERVASMAWDLRSQRLRDIALDRLALVYDAAKRQVLGAPAGIWAHAMAEAAASVKAAAFAHVLPRKGL